MRFATKSVRDESGQILVEFQLSLLLVVLPLLLGGITWFWISFDRARCAHLAFQKARRQLIQTHQSVLYTHSCGNLQETLRLSPLEALDLDKGALDFEDLANEGSELWEAASQSWRQLSESDSLN